MEIAKSGLFMAQKQLNVTGHNISNANTDGYTRQRIVQQNVDPNFGPNFIAQRKEFGLIGQGVTLYSLDQIRNPYYDIKYREENASANMWSVRSTELHYVELKFDPTTDTGIMARFNSFKDAVGKFKTEQTDNVEIRTNMRDQAISLCESFHAIYNDLLSTQTQQNDSLAVMVEDVNRIVDSIASLNREIYRFELSEQSALDLRDHRNLLMDELSNLINFEYSYDTEDKLTISIDGVTLVDHTKAYHLAVEEQADVDPITGQQLYDVIWADDNPDGHPDGAEGELVTITSGEMMGRLTIRDGNTHDSIGIPYIVDQLNQLARAIAEEFNNVHAEGWTMPDPANGVDSETGIMFFAGSDDYSEVNAGNLWLSDEVMDSIYMIAASSEYVDASGTTEGTSNVANQENAIALFELLESKTAMGGSSSFIAFFEGLTTTVGVQAKAANDNFDVSYSVLSNTVTARTSYSGVSLDEEMTSMLKFQHAYKAASRMITTLDEQLDKLINGTGRVGL